MNAQAPPGPVASAAAAEVVLRVSHLGVEFDGKVIFQDLNFEVGDRETLSIPGPNGAGKTVLLRSLLGLVPCHGQVSWRAGVRIGYVPQRVPLNKELPATAADFFWNEADSAQGRRQPALAGGNHGWRLPPKAAGYSVLGAIPKGADRLGTGE